MKKKWMSIVLVVMTIMASISMQSDFVWAAENPALIARANCEQVKCDETFTVDVMLRGDIYPASGQTKFMYDHNKLEAVKVTKGNILTNQNVAMGEINLASNGEVYVAFLYNVDQSAEAGTLFSIQFKVKSNAALGNTIFSFAETEFNKTDFTTVEVDIESEEVEIMAPTAKWVQDNVGWWYQRADGSYPVSCWEKIDGAWYYFNASGYRVANQWSGNYYLQNNGVMATNQWIGAYYVGADGAYIAQSGWLQLSNSWYYLGNGGVRQTGWQSVGGTWYYFSTDGKMVTGWQSIGGTWYYFAGSGAMVTGWQSIGGTWYYFAGSGAMVTGWQSIGGTWYYLTGSGAMASGQWIGNYYLNTDGSMATNQWIGSYYVGSDGAWIPGMTR